MRPEFADLRTFYATRQGQLARRVIAHSIRQAWPDLCRKRVLGFGHAGPYLEGFPENCERVITLTPRGHAVCRYPVEGRSRTALCDERDWPLPDCAVDCVVLVHALETSERPARLLREAWRVLADGGRLMVVVPNRTGVWCLRETTPFGHGRPYSVGQIERRLRDVLFEPLQATYALFMPPVNAALVQRTATWWERIGRRYAQAFGGVLLVEAEKRVFAGNLRAFSPAPARRYVGVGARVAAARDRQPFSADEPDQAG